MTPFQAHHMSVGRNWALADRAELVAFNDGASARFHWNDGAQASMWHDTKAEAVEQLESLGFFVKETP